ncbi:hypothetical protein KFK09_001294 [Dendrobium nobile]|uniref:Rx N-terminal domain-containing protein n=1 Tax=Dendrobium nobile TaxID=94219 RepID=A0A8T3CAH6_DENNO|nr:hypothetical protein KFK09_001294 [Dendrobium nobile]
MAIVLAAFVKNLAGLLTDYVAEEEAILVGVKDELQKLQEQMMNIQCLLKDAERRKFDSSSIKLWLSQHKDVMYEADDIIDLCRIEGHKLLADQNPESNISPVCCNFSYFFSCLVSVPLRHQIGNEIKEINKRLKRIYKNRKQFNLESLTESKTQVPDDSRLTSSMASPSDVGREVDDAAHRLVNRKSFFLVLDNLWTASVWVNWLEIPLIESNATVRVLVTTRHQNVAVDMRAVHIHRVELLSEESSWDTLCRRLFSAEEVEIANELKELLALYEIQILRFLSYVGYENLFRYVVWISVDLVSFQVRFAEDVYSTGLDWILAC